MHPNLMVLDNIESGQNMLERNKKSEYIKAEVLKKTALQYHFLKMRQHVKAVTTPPVKHSNQPL